MTGGGLPAGTDPSPAYDVEVRERSEPSPRCRVEARGCAVLAITADGRDWAWDRSLETDEPLLLQSPEHRWSLERATAFLEAFSGHGGNFSAGMADLELEEYGVKALLHRCGPMHAVANAIEIYAAKDDLVRLADEIRKIITGAGHFLR